MSYPAIMSDEALAPTTDDSAEIEEYLDHDDQPFLVQKGRRLKPHVAQEVLKRYRYYRKAGKRVMEACELVAEKMGLEVKTVWDVQNRLQPTTQLATAMLQSGAAKLMGRVLRKANVDQAIDLLSRPNIGVLAPVKGGVGDTGSQFVIGVAVDSLGAVKVGVQMGHSMQQPKAPVSPSVNVYTPDEVEGEDESESGPNIEVFPAKPTLRLPPKQGVMASSKNVRTAQANADLRAQKSELRKSKRAVKAAADKLREEMLRGGGA